VTLSVRPQFDEEPGEVVDVDRPDAVAAAVADPEDRQAAQQPGDVVEQHAGGNPQPVRGPEQDGGAGDRIGHAGG
jgi:hypothetical protein